MAGAWTILLGVFLAGFFGAVVVFIASGGCP